MLTRTFLFLERIGYRREKKLWQQGISNWKDFLNREKIKGISRSLWRSMLMRSCVFNTFPKLFVKYV